MKPYKGIFQEARRLLHMYDVARTYYLSDGTQVWRFWFELENKYYIGTTVCPINGVPGNIYYLN